MTARRATLVLAVALVLVAATFGTSSLYVPGVALLLAFATAGLWVWRAARRAQVVHEPGPRTLVEGEPYPLDVVVHASGLPLPGGRVTHPLATSPARLGTRSPARVRLEVASLRRGWQWVTPVTLRVTDPLRLTAAEVPALDSNRVLVLPRIEPVLMSDDAVDGAARSNVTGAGIPHGSDRGKRSVEFEMDGLRSYRHGSPASRIHWPILARTGELVERRLVGGATASPVVVLDAESPANADALDRAVRAAASLCVHLAPVAGCVLLLPGERAPHRIDSQLRLWPAAHARLALVEGGVPPPDYRSAGHDTAVFWVSACTEAAPVPRWPDKGIRYLVTPSPLPSADSLFTVAGCHGSRPGATTGGLAPTAQAA